MKKAVKLYVAYWNPNGTNDLYVQFEDGSLEFMAEALYGHQVNDNSNGRVTVVGHYGLDEIDFEELEMNPDLYQVVRPISLTEALSGISCSPVNDGSETAKRLYALFTNKAVSNE